MIPVSTSISADDVLAAIRTRRSIGKCTDVVPDRALIEQLLEAARWAPSHKQTEPWRFIVLSGDARLKLDDALGEASARLAAEQPDARGRKPFAPGKTLRAPYLIAAYVEPQPANPEIEEIAAGAAAIQNMLLAANALGLAAMWRSGELVYTPEVRDCLRLPEDAVMLGVIYVGYAATEAPQRERHPIESFTEWRDEA